MKPSMLLLIVALPLVGCNTLKKQFGTGSHDAPNNSIADDYTVTGTTSSDYQVIQPIRCLDSEVSVRVKVPGATEFRTLNKYEFKADPSGVGGGGVWFGKHVDVTLDQNGKPIFFIIYGTPAAPVGTQYEIRSVLLTVDHNLY